VSNDPPTSPPGQARGGGGLYTRSVETAEQDAEAARLRGRGLSYRQIGAQLNIDPSTAYRAVKRALAEIVAEPAADAVAFELERLDTLYARALEVMERHHVAVSNGRVVALDGEPLQDDGPVLAAITALVRISESRRKLLGLDSPTKTAISGGLTYEIVGITPEALR
jgi:DNA-binding CsgD family transcriptional regulator